MLAAVKVEDVATILRALNEADVRYLIVGGIAVVAHGYVRYTADLDIVLHLERENILRAMNALTRIGYQPSIPVRPTDLANDSLRKSWKEEKGMLVFQVINLQRTDTRLDIFVTEPFDFEVEFAQAKWEDVGGTAAPVLRVQSLIEMKRAAGRDKDLIDADALVKIVQSRSK